MRSKWASTIEEGEIPKTYGVWTGEDYPLRSRIFLSRNCSSCATKQWCEFGKSGPTSTETLEKLAVNVGRWRNARRSKPVTHDGEWPYSFLQAACSTLVYCCRYTNIDFINSSTFAALWTAYKGAFVQDPLTANHSRLHLQWAHEHRAR